MQPAFAQNTLDLVQDGVNNSYKPPVLKGPTSIPQTMHFFDNHNGSIDQGIYFRKPEPALSVTSVLATNLLPIFLST
ncbi:hypothetical protein [Dyadobacter aurulentus]|uniref:hypothetical protein n=1 Tax=Dyadobacter sp. UC 10 TaxID=2605428 RepID=UPI001788DDC8|nr:hypothetical protein [Dyadobacter sp. UC 10]